jgi:hypothetical protein
MRAKRPWIRQTWLAEVSLGISPRKSNRWLRYFLLRQCFKSIVSRLGMSRIEEVLVDIRVDLQRIRVDRLVVGFREIRFVRGFGPGSRVEGWERSSRFAGFEFEPALLRASRNRLESQPGS